MTPRQIFFSAIVALLALNASACGSAWSEAELSSVESYCSVAAGEHAGSCASWIDGIHRFSNCEIDQAKRVIDQIVQEYNGAPALSVAENYELAGCEYGAR